MWTRPGGRQQRLHDILPVSVVNPGHVHAIKYIYDFEGVRNYDWGDELLDEDFLTASNDALKPYASAYFEYDSSHRITEAWFNARVMSAVNPWPNSVQFGSVSAFA